MLSTVTEINHDNKNIDSIILQFCTNLLTAKVIKPATNTNNNNQQQQQQFDVSSLASIA